MDDCDPVPVIACEIHGVMGVISWVKHDPRCTGKCGCDERVAELNKQYREVPKYRSYGVIHAS